MRAIFLENIRSLNNVWAIIRTADGAWFDRVVCVGYTPTPPRKEISKTALGAENWVPWEYYEKIEDAIEAYKNLWCTIVVMEKNERSVPIWRLKIEDWRFEKICLITGNELEWVSETAQKMADHICHLPMLGKKESLNVAVAAWIGMYHFVD
jgi:23S rRNA (guanosine2251-2'-O)-methyltransferase